jgi:hypothetical protein
LCLIACRWLIGGWRRTASSATPASSAASAVAGRFRGIASFHCLSCGRIEFVGFAGKIVSKALAVARPSHVYGSGSDRAGDLGLHLDELIVTRHFLDSILS